MEETFVEETLVAETLAAVRLVEETFVEETEAPTILPLASRAVDDTLPSVVWPETARAAVVRFVEDTLVEETLFAERLVEETEAKVDWPVTVKVPACRLPDPVAFVNVMFVDDTVVANTLVLLKFPAKAKVPVADTLNWVLEFTCRSIKLPTKVEEGLEPIKVPVTFESWMGFSPSWTKAELVDAGGMAPERRRAVAAESVDWR